MTTTAVYCINDRYTPTRDGFESVEAFLAMCRGCFGEAPELRESSPGTWTGVATGEVVLEAGEAEADHGTLRDYQTGDPIRPATAAEAAESAAEAASDIGGGSGVIEIGGRLCYVS